MSRKTYFSSWCNLCWSLNVDFEVKILHVFALPHLELSAEQYLLELGYLRTDLAVGVRPFIDLGSSCPIPRRRVITAVVEGSSLGPPSLASFGEILFLRTYMIAVDVLAVSFFTVDGAVAVDLVRFEVRHLWND